MIDVLEEARRGVPGGTRDTAVPKERYGCLTGAACVRQVGASGLCLAVDEGGTADGADIEQQPYASLTRQQWQIIAV